MRKQAARTPITTHEGSYQLQHRLAGEGALSAGSSLLPFSPAAAAPGATGLFPSAVS